MGEMLINKIIHFVTPKLNPYSMLYKPSLLRHFSFIIEHKQSLTSLTRLNDHSAVVENIGMAEKMRNILYKLGNTEAKLFAVINFSNAGSLFGIPFPSSN